MKFSLEIIGFNIESCLVAQQAGANRIELCDGPGEGGITPSYAFIKMARQKLDIELYVMIRPRGGDFLYHADEFQMMKEDVLVCKELGCDGIVTGILNANGSVDIARNKELVELAKPMKATFHRAFDRVSDPVRSLEDLVSIGFERVLTSGGRPTAMEGVEALKELVKAAGNRITIMPGSGVNEGNLVNLAQKTGAREFHSSASKKIPSEMQFTNSLMQEELSHVSVNGGQVKEMARLIQVLENGQN